MVSLHPPHTACASAGPWAMAPSPRPLELEGLLAASGARGQPRAGRADLAPLGPARVLLGTFLALSVCALAITWLRPRGPVHGARGDDAAGVSRPGGGARLRQLRGEGPNYTVVIDCGSTHTTLHVFEARAGVVKEVEPDANRGKAGYPPEIGPLADYIDAADDLRVDLAKLINESLRFVPQSRRIHTPLYMYATAGMRLYPPQVQRSVFERAADVLSDLGAYAVDASHLRTISEEEEAVFAYLAANQEACQGAAPCNDTVGVLEMGGGSLQVAFAPRDAIMSEAFTFNIGAQRRSIYAKGFMRFGQNEALAKSIVALADGGGNLSTLEHPCFLCGYSGDFNISLDAGDVTAHVVGAGDAAACDELLTRLLHLDYECDLPPCGIRGEYMPKPSGVFLGLSGFKYAVTNFDLPLTGTTPLSLKTRAEEFCTRKDSDLLGTNAKFLQRACFLGLYAYRVLRSLGFHDGYAGLDFSRKVVWPVGAVLYETIFPEGARTSAGRRLQGPRPRPLRAHASLGGARAT
mmetsp:Transcript_123582/g.335594  ORF Transcript_123582/g.335594 Transcript_123582/m.335594 type:complete len:521 (+) Transcript_123582:25-1587(+)